MQPSVLKEALESALAEGRRHLHRGRVASYIPELARADPSDLGVALADMGGRVHTVGDCGKRFTLQSVAKVFSLLLALDSFGPDHVFARVGMEPTGDPFNSILKLELLEPSKPLNPMINAGALAVCSLLLEGLGDLAFDLLVDSVRRAAGSPLIAVDKATFTSERSTGDRNRALAYFLKEVGGIKYDVGSVLDFYFRQCSLTVTCEELARMGLFLAGYGGAAITPTLRRHIRIVNTFLVTCGMYNGSGEFAIRVGIPAKSGVSGAIMGVVPHRFGIGCFGPALEERGNSVGGVELLAALSQALSLSIF